MTGPGTSGMGPLGDLQVTAAMLRQDRGDVASYVAVLSGALAGALPPGMVEVSSDRSLGDRLAGRPGRPVGVLVHGTAGDFELTESRGRTVGQLRRTVNGVVIARREIGVDEWVALLTAELNEIAARDSRAAQALTVFLRPA